MSQKRVFSFIFFCCCFVWGSAQYQVSGIVIDKETNEPIPFVNIIASPTGEGASTDFDGIFNLKSSDPITAIEFSYIGYDTYTYRITTNVVNGLRVELNPGGIQIEEAVVEVKKKRFKRPKDTLAISLQQQVVDHKEENRPKSFDSYYYREHNKIEFDFYQFDEKLTKRKILKPFRVAFDYIDTTDNGVAYLPLLLQEKLSEHYFTLDPKKQKDIILGQYMTGVENVSATVIVDDIFEPFDLYDNVIYAGGKSFPSPFSNSGLLTYRYYLVDSVIENNKVYYNLYFTPRSKDAIAFDGNALIDKSSYAIKSIEFSMPKQANINFVGEFKVKQFFEEVDDGKWMLKGESIQIALNPTGKKNAKSLLVKKNMERDSIVINKEFDENIFAGERIIFNDSLDNRSVSWWEKNRVQALNKSESGVVLMTDSIENTRAYKNYLWLGNVATTAFLKAGPVEFGRFYQFVSWNDIEGVRPKMGIRTNKDFNKNIQLWGYLAYGLKDEKFKSFANVRIMLPRVNNNWHTLELNYKDDYTFLGVDYDDQQFAHDNGFLALLRIGNPLKKIMRIKSYSITHEKQWVNGYTTKFNLQSKTFFATPNVFDFKQNQPNGTVFIDKFSVAEIGIEQHIAFGQKFFENTYYRFEGFSKKPIIDIKYKLGLKNIGGGDYAYHKLELNFFQRLPSRIGYSYIFIDAGKIFGDIPYPLMFIPLGNENFYYYRDSYNVMGEFEFASDQFSSFWLEHHFDGVIFNRIPLISKLNLRSLVSAKALIGNVKQSNLDNAAFPFDMRVPYNWYVEAGFGIENILQLLRVDCYWRVTQRNQPEISNFGLKISVSPKL